MSAATTAKRGGKTKFHLAGGSQPLILVPVHVNGRGPHQFILDTGAGTSLLSSELAKQLDVEIVGSRNGQSAGGEVAVSLGRVNSFSVGKTTVTDVDVGIIDLSQIGKTVGAQIDGDLGYNFLKDFRVTIDYRDCEITFDHAKTVNRTKGSAKVTIPFRLAGPAKPLVLIHVFANGTGPFQFAIDTGTSTTAITPELAKRLQLKTEPLGSGTTAGASVAVTAGELKSFQIGGAKIDNLAVVVADFFPMLSKAIGANLDGIVGYNFLRNYKVVLDYPNEHLSLM